MKKFTTLSKKLWDVQKKYEDKVFLIEQSLKDKIDFKFGLEFQPSDGWTIVSLEDTKVSPIYRCLFIIDEKGVLSYEDFIQYTI